MPSTSLDLKACRPSDSSFYVVAHSSLEKAIAFPHQTTSDEKVEDFLNKNRGKDFFYRKEFLIALCRVPKVPIAMVDAVLYNAPLLHKNEISVSRFIDDDEKDKTRMYENEFLRSISDENGMLSSRFVDVNSPFLLIRGISVIPKLRNLGYGRYLFENFENYLQGVYGVFYGDVFAPGYTFVLNEDLQSEQGFEEFLRLQKRIIGRFLRDGNFKRYREGEDRFFRKREKRSS